MKIAVISYSLSNQPGALKEWKNNLLNEIKNHIESGADIIVYPELFLMGLTDYFQGELPHQLEEISKFTVETLLPEIKSQAKGKDILICLGSGPRILESKIYNSAHVLINGEWEVQDKLHLTPWETSFTGGEALKVFTYKGLKLSVVICFDIEQPSLALKLKEEGVHMLLVPSATTDRNGSNRVNRCANSRSVELGCVVITAPLIGDSKCDLVDHNEGRQGLFFPAQHIVKNEQELYSAYSSDKKITESYVVDEKILLDLKLPDSETKPFLQKDHDYIRVERS